MKLKIDISALILTVLLIAGLGMNAVAQRSEQSSLEEYSQRYNQATTEHERLQICIEAMDNGVIQNYMKVADIEKLFGVDFSSRFPAEGEQAWGTIKFKPIPPNLPRDDSGGLLVQVALGWHFAFKFNHSGTITNYFVSNVSK